ncbi:MAG: hypothetical protein CL917_16405 [Deltaproteobacteria bacterium]|nr:hypothetical protein [Deltaproteobacteria bacterium]
MSVGQSRWKAYFILGVGLVVLVLGGWSGAQYRRATLFSPFFYAPSGLAVSPAGEILVAVEEARIHIYNSEGTFLRGWGIFPDGGPVRMQPESESVQIATENLDTVSVYGYTGQLNQTFDEAGAYSAFGADHDTRVIGPEGDLFELAPGGLFRISNGEARLIVTEPKWPLSMFGSDPVVPVAALMALGAVGTMLGVVMTANTTSRPEWEDSSSSE